MIALTSAKHALTELWKRPLHVLLSCVLDILFLFAYGLLTQFPRNEIFSSAANLTQTFSNILTNAAVTYNTPSMLQLFFDKTAIPYTLSILFWIVVLLLIVYALYALFQGFAWKIAAGTPLAQFAKISAAWFVPLGLLNLTVTIIDLRAILVQQVTQQPASTIPHTLFVIILCVVAYFFILATAIVKDSWKHASKMAFVLGTRKLDTLLPAAALLVGTILVANALIMWTFAQNNIAGSMLGVILVFPGLFAIRTYLAHVMEALHDRQHA
jgi:hypothetical protein